MKRDGNSGFDERHHRGDESHLLREIVRTHQVMMHGLSRSIGMPGARFALLRLLATSERALGVMELARVLNVNAAAITRQVQEMESEGLIRRRSDVRDKRRHGLCLSAKGMRVFGSIHERSHRLEDALRAVVAPEEMVMAGDVLRRVREFMEHYAEGMSDEVVF